jgi:hypothetical protein
MQSFAEVDTIGIQNNKCSSQMIEPLKRSLTQQVHKEHVFYIEDAIASGEKFARNPQEFPHPISCEPALEDEQRTVVVFWNRNSQHDLSLARASPFAKGPASRSVFKEKFQRNETRRRRGKTAMAAHAAIAAHPPAQEPYRGQDLPTLPG